MIKHPFSTVILVTSALVLSLNGCSLVSQLSKGTKSNPNSQKSDNAQPGGSTAEQSPSSSDGQPTTLGANLPSIDGNWQVAFQVGNKTFHANMQLQQQGNEFAGTGADEPTNREFAIEEGVIDQGSVHFFKRYPGADPNSMPPVEYTGKFENVTDGPPDQQGLWVSGEYATTFQGNPLRGEWEGHLAPNSPNNHTAQANGSAEPNVESGSKHGPPPDPNKAPHLSGKWQVGYEFSFKTIKSTMYLEQDGGKITGHGIDKNTKEKFSIEKGWYNFPRVTLVRNYIKGKGAAANRTMTFKAQVSNINDADYQGPYLKGKTDGGGEWEAQLYR